MNKNYKQTLENPKSTEVKKLSKVRAMYGKAKSPSESSSKFISPQEQVYVRNSPFANNSPLHLNHSSSQFQNSKLSNSTSLNGLNAAGYLNQRSRHHNSVKYSNSVNINGKVKPKANKKSKGKKVNSFGRITDANIIKFGHQQNTNYELVPKQSVNKNLVNLGGSKWYVMSSNSQKRKNSKSIPKSNERGKPNLSQERIQQRENSKHKIVNFIGKYIKQSSEIEIDNDYEDTLNNLKDFLWYLEDKKIINGQQLEDKNEVNNLIKDLMNLDLSKFRNLRKKHKTGSRNVHVSVNRSNSTNAQDSRAPSHLDPNSRKSNTLTTKNIYKVWVPASHDKENQDDFKSSRKLSFLPDSENKANKYQSLASANQTPKGFFWFNKAATPQANSTVAAIIENAKKVSNRYGESGRGKTVPTSHHSSKERTETVNNLEEEMPLKEKQLSHNKWNSLLGSNNLNKDNNKL